MTEPNIPLGIRLEQGTKEQRAKGLDAFFKLSAALGTGFLAVASAGSAFVFSSHAPLLGAGAIVLAATTVKLARAGFKNMREAEEMGD